ENPSIDIFVSSHLIFSGFNDIVFKENTSINIKYPKKDFVFENGDTRGIFFLGNASDNVIKKSVWTLYAQIDWSADNETDSWKGRRFIGALFIQVYVMSSMIKNGAKLKYLTSPICMIRGDIILDTMIAWGGLRKRILCDIKIMKEIPECVFGKGSKEARWMANQLMFNVEKGLIRGAKTGIFQMNLKMYKELFIDLFKGYRGNFFLYFLVLPAILTPSFIYKSAAFLYRRTLKKRRIVKTDIKLTERNNA
ncbi:MAG: hypothetical protein LBH29_03470, partial [Elusimicrobiota bacterium]|nr:hypothetical protein [Elusimicrobiota bacterium]